MNVNWDDYSQYIYIYIYGKIKNVPNHQPAFVFQAQKETSKIHKMPAISVKKVALDSVEQQRSPGMGWMWTIYLGYMDLARLVQRNQQEIHWLLIGSTRLGSVFRTTP